MCNIIFHYQSGIFYIHNFVVKEYYYFFFVGRIYILVLCTFQMNHSNVDGNHSKGLSDRESQLNDRDQQVVTLIFLWKTWCLNFRFTHLSASSNSGIPLVQAYMGSPSLTEWRLLVLMSLSVEQLKKFPLLPLGLPHFSFTKR